MPHTNTHTHRNRGLESDIGFATLNSYACHIIRMSYHIISYHTDTISYAYQVHTQYRPNAYRIRAKYKPKTYQVHTRYIPNTYQIQATYRPGTYRIHYIPNTYQVHTTYIPTTSQVHTKYMPSTYLVQAKCMPSAYHGALKHHATMWSEAPCIPCTLGLNPVFRTLGLYNFIVDWVNLIWTLGL